MNGASASRVFPDMISTPDSALCKAFPHINRGRTGCCPPVFMLEPDDSRLPSPIRHVVSLGLPEERLDVEPGAAASATAAELILRLTSPDLPWRDYHVTSRGGRGKHTQQYGLRSGTSEEDTKSLVFHLLCSACSISGVRSSLSHRHLQPCLTQRYAWAFLPIGPKSARNGAEMHSATASAWSGTCRGSRARNFRAQVP